MFKAQVPNRLGLVLNWRRKHQHRQESKIISLLVLKIGLNSPENFWPVTTNFLFSAAWQIWAQMCVGGVFFHCLWTWDINNQVRQRTQGEVENRERKVVLLSSKKPYYIQGEISELLMDDAFQHDGELLCSQSIKQSPVSVGHMCHQKPYEYNQKSVTRLLWLTFRINDTSSRSYWKGYKLCS